MTEDIDQRLRLIYSQLIDAENDPGKRLELLERSRQELGQMIKKMDGEAKPGLYAFMAESGAKGGAVKSSAKAAAARANGAKGGRPKTFTFNRFTEDSVKALLLTQEEAKQLGHRRCGTEQLLLGLIGVENGRAAQALSFMGLTLTDARATVKQLVGQGHDFDADLSAPQSGVIATLVRSLREYWKEFPFSPLAKRALESSWDEARNAGENCIGTEHLLLGILDVQDCRGLEVLRLRGIDIIKLRETLKHV